MKKLVCFCLLMCGILLLGGCGGLPEENTLSIDKKGRVTSTIVEDFDKDFYDEEELRSEIEEELADYNKNFASDHITMKKFEVKDGKATLQLTFDESKYYADYTGFTLFAGTISEAEAEGYDLSGEFLDADGSLTDLESLEDADKAKVLILEEAVQVTTPGRILAVSPSDQVTITGSKQAAVQEAELSYIIYK